MNYPRIMIAAPKSGSGKTTVTCGILAALKQQNIDVCSFKCGPDYIDPMFHRNVLDIPAGNLDTFFTDDITTKQLFEQEFAGDMAVIEGVMGLYDGVGGVQMQGSSYDLARVLKAPIVLVVDARGAGRSVLAEIRGFLDYDNEALIKGVILNKTSKSFADILKPLIEDELGIACLGYVENRQDIELSSRHLGLIIPEEVEDIRQKLNEQATLILEGVDLDAVINIAQEAPILSQNDDMADDCKKESYQSSHNSAQTKVRIAVARDKAFCFYYRENLELLERLGAELIYFSPIRDSHLPKDVSGLILGGGYPENYLKELSANHSLMEEIRDLLSEGMPAVAECGGFMYLTNDITDEHGVSYPMAGYIDASTRWTGKLVRFGYIELNDGSRKIRGHEFHYFDTDNNGEDCVAAKPSGKRPYSCMHHKGSQFIGFPHLYYPSCPDFAKEFIQGAMNWQGIH